MATGKTKHSVTVTQPESQSTSPLILNREQVAEKLVLTPRQISELIRKRAKRPLPCVRFGKHIRFVAADVDAWISQQRQDRAA